MDKSTEAPASITLSVEIDGYPALVTMRAEQMVTCYANCKKLIQTFKIDGVKPQVKTNGFAKKPEVPVDPNSPLYCKLHNVMMKERTGQDGSSYMSHSGGTYPNLKWCTNGRGFPGEQTAASRTDWHEVAPF